MHNCHIQ